MSNTKSAIKNGIYGSASQILIFVLKFIERRFFVLYLSIEYLGLKSLFGNIFSLLSVSELGISSIICYQLYSAIAKDDKEEINKLMSIYRLFYVIIGLFIFFAGILCNFCLPYIVSNQTVSWDYLRQVYFLMLINTVSTYFLSYRMTLYIASQKEYICMSISVVVEIVFSVIKLLIIYIYKDFILYLLFDIIKSIFLNLIIYVYAKRIFNYLSDNKQIHWEDIKKRNIFYDIKNILYGKIAAAVYFGTDNILISRIFGIDSVAIYANYYLLYTSFRGITFTKYIGALNPSTANFLHMNNDYDVKFDLFKKIDLFNHYCALIFSIGFLFFSNVVIYYWLGAEYLFDYKIVLVYCIYIYVETSFEALYTYRAAYGDFDFDKKYFMFAAIFNILCSIVLSKLCGISGIILGTVVGFIFIAYGRGKFVYYKVMQFDIKEYIFKHLKMFTQFSIIIVISYMFEKLLNYSIMHIAFRVLYLMFSFGIYIFIMNIVDKEFNDLKEFARSVLLQYSKVKNVYEKLIRKEIGS